MWLTIMFFRSFLGFQRDAQVRPCSSSGIFTSINIESVLEILRYVVYKFLYRQNAYNDDGTKCMLFINVIEKTRSRKHGSRLVAD